jgi:hypothetical protein
MALRRGGGLWYAAVAMVALLQWAGVAHASSTLGGVTHVVVPCYNEEKRLPIQKFLQFTADEVRGRAPRAQARRALRGTRAIGWRRAPRGGHDRSVSPAVTRSAVSRHKTPACSSRLSTTAAPTRRSGCWRTLPRSGQTGSRCPLLCAWARLWGRAPCVEGMQADMRSWRLANAASRACAQVHHLSKNGGKAEAVRKGMLHVLNHHNLTNADFIAFWDADLVSVGRVPATDMHAALE